MSRRSRGPNSTFMHTSVLPIVMIVMAGAVVFANTLTNDFQLDDFYRVVDNPAIQTISRPWRHFIDPSTMSTLPRITAYRPLLPLTLSINYRLHHYSLPGYHLTNLLLHLIGSIILYFLCLELLSHWGSRHGTERLRSGIALCVSLLFTIHPVSGILVNYICSRDLILMQMFLLGSLLAYIHMRRSGMTSLRWALVLFLFLGSLLSKTNAVMAPFLILLFEFTLARQRVNDWKVWSRAIPFILIIFAFFAFTRFALGFSEFEQVLATNDSFWTYPLTQAKVHLTHYLFNFVCPWFIRQAPYVEPAKSIGEPFVFLGIVLILATLLLAWRERREEPLLTFCLVSYWLMLAPTSSLFPFHHLAVHYVPYPASPWLFLALTLAAVRYGYGKEKKLLIPILPILIFLILYFSLASVWLNRTWKSQESLWTHSVRYGGEALAHLNLAMSIHDRKDPRVRQHLEQALRLQPAYVLAHIDLGLLLIDLGQTQKGLDHCRQAVQLRPEWGQPHFWLSRAYSRLGLKAEAAASSAQAADLEPRNLRYQYQAALDAQNVGEYQRSLGYLDAGERIQPGYERTCFLKGFALQMLGNLDQAVDYYRRYQKRDPDHIQTEFNLAHALMTQGNFREAIEHFTRTLELAPNYREAHLHLARCYGSLGRKDEEARHLSLYRH